MARRFTVNATRLRLNRRTGCARRLLQRAVARAGLCVGGTAIVPQEISVPSLVILPATDRIVPPLSAKALAESLPKATVMTPPLGHIGMVVARDAPKVVWGKLNEWVRA